MKSSLSIQSDEGQLGSGMPFVVSTVILLECYCNDNDAQLVNICYDKLENKYFDVANRSHFHADACNSRISLQSVKYLSPQTKELLAI
jgi:hypothetical protein